MLFYSFYFFSGQCAEPVTTGGVTRTISCDVLGGSNFSSCTILLLLSTCFLQSSSLWMISSSGWMDQLRIVAVTVATSTLPYLQVVAVAVRELVLILIVVLAFSSKSVPVFVNTLRTTLRTTHNQTQEGYRSSEILNNFLARRTSTRRSNSTTCYAGGGGGDKENLQVRE